MLNKFFYLVFTLKDLKLSQIIHFILFYFKKRKFYKVNAEINQKKLIYKKPFFLKTPERLNYKRKTYKFGNFEKKINFKNWNCDTHDKLWVYNLFYFDFLFEKKFINRKKISLEIIYKWIKISYKKDDHTMWDPYPTSIRLINLIKFSLFNKINSKILNESIFNHINHLEKNLEFRLKANHLLTNLISINCGKLFLGIDDFYYKKLLKNEIDIQFQKYIHYEKTPSYHNLLVEQLIIYSLVKRICKNKVEKKFLIFIEKLISTSKNLSHPDDKLAFFNDTNYESLDYKHLKFLFEKNFKKTLYLKDQMQKSYPSLQNKNIFLITKCCGPEPKFNPGHSHADSLSFEISVKGKRLLINKGVSTYEKNSLRILQRSTESHNTVKIDDKNSSEVWSSFRVGKKSQVFDIKINKINNCISAYHNGYSSFFKKISHIRTWRLRGNSLSIDDKILGNFKKFQIFFHFYPNVNISKKDNQIHFQQGEVKGIITFSNAKLLSIKNSFYYPKFGIQKRIKSLIVDCDKKNNKTFIYIKK